MLIMIDQMEINANAALSAEESYRHHERKYRI